MEYDVIVTPNLIELVEEVNKSTSLGWVVAGGVTATSNGYIQAIYRDMSTEQASILKFSPLIAKSLEEASTALSYNECNDIPEAYWGDTTLEDKSELLDDAFAYGVIDAEQHASGWLGDSCVAKLFAKWFKALKEK